MRGAVQFRDVRFGYDPAAPVLDGFDLELAAGQSVAIVGATGSGKSTVARLLVRFYDVDEGRVRIDGVNVRDLSLHDVRRAVGIVFEDTLLFHDTVAANIAFAEPDADRRLDRARARGSPGHTTSSWACPRRTTRSSASAACRCRAASASASPSPVRSSPTRGCSCSTMRPQRVDPSKEHEIRSAMATVMDGRTTIVIAHRPGTIALADTVVLLDDGRVVASGPHQELLDREPRYRNVLAAMEAADDVERDELPPDPAPMPRCR